MNSLIIAAGTIIDNKYKLLELLGEGGLGAVYKAIDMRLETIVAIKFMHMSLVANEKSRRRFMREGRMLAKLQHPHILKVQNLGIQSNQFPYIVTEYVSGESLRQVLDRVQKLPVDRCLKIMMQVCEAMDLAHSAGIMHRDLTPGNIMLEEKSDDFVKIIDFGFSRLAGENEESQQLTESGAVLGSVYYMSPEQATGKSADVRTDIYSLGCVMFHAFTGTTPFDADNAIGLLRKQASEQQPPLAKYMKPQEIPDGLEAVIAKCMKKAPDQRYQTMKEVQADLQLVATGAGANLSKPRPTAPVNVKEKATVLAAVVICGVLLIAFGWFAYFRSGKPVQPSGGMAEPSLTRKLRSPESVATLTSEQRLRYYETWLRQNRGTGSLDEAMALFRLAKELAPQEPARSEAHLHDSLKIIKGILHSALKSSDAARLESGIGGLTNVLTYQHCEPELIDELSALTKEMSAVNKQKLDGPISLCRQTIMESCLKTKDYKGALKIAEETLNEKEQHSTRCDQRLTWLLTRAKCLHHLGNDEATAQATEAFNLAKSFAGTPFIKLDLVDLLIKLKKPQLAVELAEQVCVELRASIRQSDANILPSAIIAKANALEAAGSVREAFSLCEANLPIWHGAGQLAPVRQMARLDCDYHLNKAQTIASQLKRIVSGVCAPLSGVDLEFVVNEAAAAADSYLKRSPRNATSIEMLNTLLRIPSLWTITPKTSYCASGIINLCFANGRSTEALKIAKDAWEHLVPYNDFQSLYSVYRVCFPHIVATANNDFICKMYEKLSSFSPEEIDNPGIRADMKSMYAQALGNRKQPEEALKATEEALQVARANKLRERIPRIMYLKMSLYVQLKDFGTVAKIGETLWQHPDIGPLRHQTMLTTLRALIEQRDLAGMEAMMKSIKDTPQWPKQDKLPPAKRMTDYCKVACPQLYPAMSRFVAELEQLPE